LSHSDTKASSNMFLFTEPSPLPFSLACLTIVSLAEFLHNTIKSGESSIGLRRLCLPRDVVEEESLDGMQYSTKFYLLSFASAVGLVVEFSPATREARVRFPDCAMFFSKQKSSARKRKREIVATIGLLKFQPGKRTNFADIL
jgi:hypothetical protein